MKKLILFFVILLVAVPSVNATPPRELKLAYDAAAQSLSIVMKHPTDENRQHYIRTIAISVNQGDAKIVRFTFQKLAWGVDTAVPISLKAGDQVHVKASCILGGSAEADLVIPAEANPDKK